MDGFIAKPLAYNQIDQAYALVRTAFPDLTVGRWRDFAAGLLGDSQASGGGGRGVMAVQNDHGYIMGLFSHTICDHLRHGRVLSVDNLIVLDLFNMTGVMEALLRSIELLAQQSKCNAVHADLPAHYHGLPESCRAALSWFRHETHGQELRRLCRMLGGAAPTPACAMETA